MRGAVWGCGRDDSRAACAHHGYNIFVQSRWALDGWERGLYTFSSRGHSSFNPRVPSDAAATGCTPPHIEGRAWDPRATRRRLGVVQCRRRVMTHAPRADGAPLKFQSDTAAWPGKPGVGGLEGGAGITRWTLAGTCSHSTGVRRGVRVSTTTRDGLTPFSSPTVVGAPTTPQDDRAGVRGRG